MAALMLQSKSSESLSFAQSYLLALVVAGVAESERLSAWWAFVTFTFPVSDSVGDDAFISLVSFIVMTNNTIRCVSSTQKTQKPKDPASKKPANPPLQLLAYQRPADRRLIISVKATPAPQELLKIKLHLPRWYDTSFKFKCNFDAQIWSFLHTKLNDLI
eukprot:scaffold39168_cov212-Skeletonema_marinoi.AAC.3